MTNSTNPTQAIVTKKVVYEVKFAGVSTPATRDAIRKVGLDYRNGQWGSVYADSGVMTEAEVVTFLTGQ